VSRIGGGCLIAGGGGAILHQALTLSGEAYRHSEALIKERSYGEGIIVGGFEIGMAGAFTLLGYSFIKIGYHLINKDQQSAKKRSGVQKGEND
jgi:hypothetical protein